MLLSIIQRAYAVLIAPIWGFLRHDQRDPALPFSFEELRRLERLDIEEARRIRTPGSDKTHEVGLAISGGGIRSSTFALGVLQGLAKSGVLAEIDYISAVSGGGYISSWLAKLIRQHGFEAISDRLSRDSTELQWLRRCISYLRSPASRHATGSTLFVVTYIHNLFSSLLSLVAVMTALLLAPWILLSFAKGILESAFLTRVVAFVGQSLVFTAAVTVSTRLARHERKRAKNVALGATAIGTLFFLCLLISANRELHSDALYALLFSLAFTAWMHFYWRERKTPNLRGRSELNILAVSGIFMSSVWLFDLSKAFVEPHPIGVFNEIRNRWTLGHSVLTRWLLSLAGNHGTSIPEPIGLSASIILCMCGLAGIIIARLLMKQSVLEWIARRCNRRILEGIKYIFSCALLFLLARYGADRLPSAAWMIHTMREHFGYQALFFYFSVLVPAGIILIGFGAGIGIVLLGRTISPYMRENLTDVIAMIYGTSLLCAGFSTVAFYGPLLLYDIPVHQEIWFGLLWIASLALAWLTPKDRPHAPAFWRYATNALVTVIPYVFIAGVLVLVSFGISRWVFQIQGWQNLPMYFKECDDTLGGGSVWLCAIVLFAAALFSARSGVNSSSMHRYYLARLSETFLGEPPSGAPKSFAAYASSGFEPEQLRIHQLRPSDGYHGPILILNCCLNARNRQDPRARLGENFVFSPRGCGFFPSDDQGKGGVFQDPSKYLYGGENGVAVASCMAISGSALGSNMGYLSSLRTRLFYTAFNFRLGWWFCNPRYPRAWNGNIPRSRISCHMKEIFGNMTDHNPFVYLSDGGHFDNLGVHELLRRQCRVIVISDASCDSRRTFAALAHTISQARIDLNVNIEFDEDQGIYRSEASGSRVTVGKIRYPDAPDGLIIYLKPEVRGTEPIDVIGYARMHPAFPHDPTSSQWFSEAQFEAYRKLGELSGEAAADEYWSHYGQAGPAEA